MHFYLFAKTLPIAIGSSYPFYAMAARLEIRSGERQRV